MAIDLRSVNEACVFVDELGKSAVGELALTAGAGISGAVFVEGGRVCWAAVRGLARRLTELLGARAGISPIEMEALFLHCQSRGEKLGEYLVAEGVVSAGNLRDALLDHTADSFENLCREGASAIWRPRAGGYTAKFTFDTAEVLATVGGARHDDRRAAIRSELAELFREDEWAAAFVRGDTAAPQPIAIIGAHPGSATELLRVGKWAVSALDVTAAFQPRDAILATNGADGAFIAFRHEPDVIVAARTDAHGPARVLNRRARGRRALGEKGGS